MTDGPSKFAQKLAERRAREEELLRKQQQETYDSDLIPEEVYEKSDTDRKIDEIVNRVDVIDAYRKYIGKSNPTVRPGQRESIKVSCPNPAHPDKTPSAWCNLDKNTWYCEPCRLGGDVKDLAAIGKNYAWPDTYKTDGSYRKLLEDIASDYGFRIQKHPGGVVTVSEPTSDGDENDNTESTEASPSSPSGPAAPNGDSPGKTDTSALPEGSEKPDAQVISLYDEDEVILPTLDWEPLAPEGTYLAAYMKQARVDDVPEEYHFFHALLGLGFALGRNVRLFDRIPVYGNLFICTMGRSGAGKSQARYHLSELLSLALPHDWSDPDSKGVRVVSAPGSAETLIFNFQKPVADPSDAKVIAYNAPVRGLIDFNELSALIGRANRVGNTLKPTLMQFYDMERVISTSSMSTGTKEAAEPFASAITSVQPKALRDLISTSDDASGFLNRWAFISGRDKKRFAVGGVVVDMKPVVKPLQEILGWAGTFTPREMIDWAPEAIDRFTEFFHTRIELDKKHASNDLTVRMDLLIKKMILLFAANRKERTVSLQSVEDAIACYDYFHACYGIPANEIGNTLNNQITEAIMAIALKQFNTDGKGITLRQIGRSLAKRKYPNEMILKHLDSLTKLGFLAAEVVTPTRGPQTVRYRYVS